MSDKKNEEIMLRGRSAIHDNFRKAVMGAFRMHVAISVLDDEGEHMNEYYDALLTTGCEALSTAVCVIAAGDERCLREILREIPELLDRGVMEDFKEFKERSAKFKSKRRRN